MSDVRWQGVFEAVEARRDALIRLLQELVRIPSVTGGEGAVQEQVEALFRARGLEIDRWETQPGDIRPWLEHVGEQAQYAGRPNVVGIRRGTGGGRSILLNAHVDTVPPGDPASWTHAPCSGELAGDRIYGRGACDMKGGLATYLIALDAVEAAGLRLAGTIRIAATVGEEDGGFGALGTILRGHRADAALIAEPTRLALVTAHAGSVVFRLTIPGRPAHGAMRHAGVSALEKFVPIYQDLLAWEAERNAALDHPLFRDMPAAVPISVGTVRAGDWHSTVPGSLVAEGRIGLMPGEGLAAFKAQVRERILAVARRDPWLREHLPELEWLGGQFAPAETPLSAPIVRAVIRAHELVTGSAPSLEGAPYGADMRLFTLVGGMPCVMYGAGDVAVAHQNDEHIAVSDLLVAAKSLAVLLIDWCGVARAHHGTAHPDL